MLVSLLYFFYLLFSMIKKWVSMYFFSKIEYIYFSFLHLILVNLLLIKKLSKFINRFFYKSKMIYNSELVFVTFFVLDNLFKWHLSMNISFIRQMVLYFVNNMLFLNFELRFLICNSNFRFKYDYLYFVIASYNYHLIKFMLGKAHNNK